MTVQPNPQQPIKGPGGTTPTAATTPETTPQDQATPPKTVPYDRFQEVIQERNAEKAELETLRQEKVAREEKEALEKGEHQKVIDSQKAQIDTLNTQLTNSVRDGAIKTAALQAGAIDPEDVLLNLRDAVKVEGGIVVGLEEMIGGLKTKKPHLFGQQKANPNAPPNPAAPPSGTPGSMEDRVKKARESNDPLALANLAYEQRESSAGPDSRR